MLTKERVQIRSLALLAILVAMCVTLRIFKIIDIPNVQPVTDMIMIVTLTMGAGFGFALSALTMILSNIYLGFGIWTIPQIMAYVGCVLVVILLDKTTPLKQHFWMQVIVATLLGYVYGLLINFGMSIWGGWSSFLGYVAGSFLFDTYHCLGNLGFYFVLYKPLTLALNNYKRKAGISYD